MKRHLIHPTHKKFVKLLRDCANDGNPVAITDDDLDDFNELCKRTKKRGERHRGVYRIVLRAIHRSPEELSNNESVHYLNQDAIDYVERLFVKLERKQLCTTLQSAYLVPILRFLVKNCNKTE